MMVLPASASYRTARQSRIPEVFLLLTFALWTSVAQAVKVYPLYLEEKPRADLSRASVRDPRGFLWVATDNGLKRYDGYNLKVYYHDPAVPDSIGSSAVNTLIISSTGDLWTAGNTLNRYNPDTDTFTNFNTSGYIGVRAIYEGSKGHFWVGGEGFGLQEFDPRTGEVRNTFFTDSEFGQINTIVGQAGSPWIWVASAGGLYAFNTNNHKQRRFHLPLDFGFGVDTIRSLLMDRHNQLWITSYAGLYVLTPDTGELVRHRAQPGVAGKLHTEKLRALFEDSRHNIWIGTDKDGVYRYREETRTYEHVPASAFNNYLFPVAAIVDITEDRYGTLWFSAGPYGMYRVSEQTEKFQVYQHSQGDPDSLGFNNILDLLEDRDGNIWIATDGGGLDRLDPKTGRFSHYTHEPDNPRSVATNSLLSLAEDHQGYIWVGTWGEGLDRLDPATGQFTHFPRNAKAANGQTLANNNIFRIQVDASNRLLLSVWGQGLQIFDPASGQWLHYHPHKNRDMKNISINDIEPAGNGDFWIAGYNGLERFSPTEERFTSVDLNIFEGVLDVHVDRTGLVWLATAGHLISYSPGSGATRYYSRRDGLADNLAVGILDDDMGFLWVATRNGLSRFDPRTETFESFDESDGLAGSQFNRHSQLRSRDDRLYVGSIQGLSVFNPHVMPLNENAPTLYFSALELYQQTQVPGKSEWLPLPLDEMETLELPHDQRDITFRFTALNFIFPEKNRFRYRLVGLEDEWLEADSHQRRVRYTNLAPGEYRFQLFSANNEGIWNGRAREIRLVILPAWWQTWWAMLLYGVGLLAFMYLFSFWRLWANRDRERELKQLVAEQTAQLSEANRSVMKLNSELEQRVAHRTAELSREIEERRESEAKATYIAYHDTLTGLYNRVWLLQHLNKLIIQAGVDNRTFALFFIGGDRFRKINDTHGHLYGDRLLVAAGERLETILQPGQHATRLGSDEFTLVVDQVEDEAEVLDLAQTIVTAFQKKFEINQLHLNFGVSVGTVVCDKSYSDPSQILRNANIAMQSAKDQGRGMFQMFDRDILQQTLAAAELEADLKLALKNDQFHVVYQPIVVVETGELSGFEILLRWQHQEHGPVSPERFIAMAESLGLIYDIGLWVLEQACRQLQRWRDELGLEQLPNLSVNMSPLQLGQHGFLNRIDDVFARTGAPRENIKFEITESALMKHTDTVDQLLEALREREIELAIDDFGTGYSSLAYLDRLPVQVLKIDRSFVNALFDENDEVGSAHEIVRATISLAHNLNMRVVAEGIETEQQLQALREYECDYGQGYLIARPLSLEDATLFLRQRFKPR